MLFASYEWRFKRGYTLRTQLNVSNVFDVVDAIIYPDVADGTPAMYASTTRRGCGRGRTRSASDPRANPASGVDACQARPRLFLSIRRMTGSTSLSP